MPLSQRHRGIDRRSKSARPKGAVSAFFGEISFCNKTIPIPTVIQFQSNSQRTMFSTRPWLDVTFHTLISSSSSSKKEEKLLSSSAGALKVALSVSPAYV